ncbi:MAG: alpha/beta hydrolase [archaeon]|nr:alpha/beta hydrolase [archaeon]
MKKVVYIPGIMGYKIESSLMKLLFKDKFKLIYFDYDTSGREKIEDIAKKLSKFINKNFKKEKVSIIGMSNGGIIADYYLKNINHQKVDKLITICSPFKGSFWANIAFKKRSGIQQLIPANDFLTNLAKKKTPKNIERISFWCKYDIVVPRDSGKGLNPKHTYFFIHQLIMYWPPLIKNTIKFLEK